MNAAAIAKRLLLFTDQRTLDAAETAGIEYLEAAVDAINAAAQQIYLLGPETISVRDFGYLTMVSSSITMSYSSGWTITSGWASNIAGNAFMLSGDTAYNRILEVGVNPAITAERAPAASFSGTSATLYNDAVAISGDIIEVLGNVTLDDAITLRAATNEANLYSESAIFSSSDYGRVHESRIAARPPIPGQPRAYYIANINPNTSGGQPTLYMRLCPYPTAVHAIRFRARVKPPTVTVDDLDAANNGADCAKEIPMPFGWHESFLLPIAKQHFTACPFFNNDSQREEISRAFKVAMENLSRTRGQSARPLNFVPTV